MTSLIFSEEFYEWTEPIESEGFGFKLKEGAPESVVKEFSYAKKYFEDFQKEATRF